MQSLVTSHLSQWTTEGSCVGEISTKGCALTCLGMLVVAMGCAVARTPLRGFSPHPTCTETLNQALMLRLLLLQLQPGFPFLAPLPL